MRDASTPRLEHTCAACESGRTRCQKRRGDPEARLTGWAGKQECGYVRTTLDLPDDLLRRAKIAAVERGTTLRELVGTALARELDPGSVRAGAAVRPRRARFPVFASKSPGKLKLGPREIAGLDAEEDARRHDSVA